MSARTAAEHIAEIDRLGAHNYAPLPIVLARGEGCFVWDVDGVRYLDALSAYSALNQGHRHPRIVAALVEQASRLTLTSRAFHNDRMAEMLARLARATGFPKALPMNTGVEAVETAIKAMRRWAYEVRGVPDDRAEIVVAEDNFHGRTIAAVSMSTDPSSFEHYGPFAPGFRKVPFGDLDAVARAIGPNTAGVLVEPIQGEAGVVIPPDGYLRGLRALCTERGAALAFDEVQTGLGRTGRMFAFEHEDARPDLLLLGKALSGGVYPVSAVCGTDALLGVFTPGTHGSTYGGNPLAAAVTIAALDVLHEERLAERAAELGARALERLRAGLSGAPGVRDVRGRGLMIAVEYDAPLAPLAARRLASEARVLCKDTHGRTLRFLPPLVTPVEVLDEAIAAMLPILRAPSP